MSKRDMRAKKLLLAVLLAMSVQSYYAAPAWAAAAGQTAGQTEMTATADAAEQNGQEAQAAEGAEKTETTEKIEEVSVNPPKLTYTARSAASGSEDYGVMPLIDAGGSLTNVTSINGVYVGFRSDTISLGSTARSASYAVVIGANASVESSNWSTAVGSGATVKSSSGVALGNSSFVDSNVDYGVAIGTSSIVTANIQNIVSFGHKAGEIYGDGAAAKSDLFRSLINVADIEMHGGLTGVTKVNDIVFSGAAISSVASINDIAIDSSRNLTNAGTYNSVGIGTTGISGTNKFNDVTIGLRGGNGTDKDNVILGTIDVTALDSNTAGIERDAATATTIETNTKINSEGLTTNKLMVSGAAATTLENGKLTVGDVTITGGKVSGLTAGDITSANSTDAVTGGQLFTVKTELNTAIGKKADKATTLAGYGIGDTYTKTEIDSAIGAKANADAGGLSDGNKTAWKSALGVDTLATTVTGHGTDIGTLKTTVGDANSGLVKRTGTLETAVNDTTKGLSATYTKAEANATSIGELKAVTTGMSYSGTVGSEMTTFTGGVTANSFAVGTTGYGFSSAGALTAKSVNEVTIAKGGTGDEIIVGGINLSELKAGSGTTGANTVGISHTGTVGNADSLTTIEVNTKINSEGLTTNKLMVSGAAATTLENGKLTVGDVTITGGKVSGLTAGDITSANSTDAVTGGQLFTAKTELNTAIGAKANADAGGLSDGNKTAWKSALGVDTLATTVTGHGTDIGTLKTTVGDANSGLVQATTGMTYNNGTTTFTGNVAASVVTAGEFKLGSTGFGFASTGDLKAKTVNGVTIKKENGADNTEEIIVGGINLSQLQSNGGTGTNTDTEGIKRTDASGDGTKDTTTIETVTSFTSAGMKTANLEAATAKIGNVQFATGGVVTNVVSINGISFADGKIGGVAFSNGNITGGTYNGAAITSTSFNGVNIKELQNKVNNLTPGTGGGGTPGTGGDNAFDSITVAGTSDNKTTISDKGIVVAEGQTNQVTINKDGIHVGRNSSVINDTDGFITDKGLYIGVANSGDLGSAKFSINSGSGALTSNVDGHKFANDGNGAVFSKGDGSDKTTINGGKIETNELWVGGNQVTVSGGTVNQTDAIDNQLTATKDGYDYTNGFTTTQTEGTTQSASKESTDKKNKWETTNNTSADGTSIKTTHTSTDSSDNKTEQSSSVVTNANGMTVSTSNKVTDKDGKVTEETTGSTTIGGGEVTLRRGDGSTIEVGSAIEGLQSDVREIDGKVNRMGAEIKEVGALSAALAGLHPQPENANSRADFAMAMGSYEGKQALAVGGFYRPDKRTMLSIGASTTSSKHMMNMGISIALDKLPEAERNEQESNADLAERMKKLEADYEARLEKMEAAYEARMERLEARYARMKDAYEADKEQQKQQETADEMQENAEAASA